MKPDTNLKIGLIYLVQNTCKIIKLNWIGFYSVFQNYYYNTVPLIAHLNILE
jgi:hypothetical protein